MYIEYIDSVGHSVGPSGMKMQKAMEELDEELGTFFKELDQRKKLDEVRVNCLFYVKINVSILDLS